MSGFLLLYCPMHPCQSPKKHLCDAASSQVLLCGEAVAKPRQKTPTNMQQQGHEEKVRNKETQTQQTTTKVGRQTKVVSGVNNLPRESAS